MGGAGSKASGKFQRGGGGGGMNGQISFQKVNFTFMPDIVNIASCSKCNEMWVQ